MPIARRTSLVSSHSVGVSRTTVYRWAGNHDQLLGEVLSGLTYATFRASEQGVRHHGRARVLAVYTNFVTYVAGSAAVAAALRRDPHQFFRVATRSGPVHRAAAVLTEELMRRIPTSVLRVAVEGESFAEALPQLHDTYTGTIAYEIEHISDHEQRVWLRQAIESGAYRAPLEAEEQRWLLNRLVFPLQDHHRVAVVLARKVTESA